MTPEQKNAIIEAYGLLWHYRADGSPNGRLPNLARVKLRDILERDDLAKGIDGAREVCSEMGAHFDPTGT